MATTDRISFPDEGRTATDRTGGTISLGSGIDSGDVDLAEANAALVVAGSATATAYISGSLAASIDWTNGSFGTVSGDYDVDSESAWTAYGESVTSPEWIVSVSASLTGAGESVSEAAYTYTGSGTVSFGGVEIEGEGWGVTAAASFTSDGAVIVAADFSAAGEGNFTADTRTFVAAAGFVGGVLAATYSLNYGDVSSSSSFPVSLAFSTDGDIMYVGDAGTDIVFQFSMPSAWDFGGATALSATGDFSTAPETAGIRAVRFKSDGSKMYVLSTSEVYQYSLGTAWTVTSAAYDSVSLNLGLEDSDCQGLDFSKDGSKMFIAGSEHDRVYSYSLSTPWDLSTASYDSESVAISDTLPTGVDFNESGLTMYVSETNVDQIIEYHASFPYDFNTLTAVTNLQFDDFYGINLDNTGPQDIVVKPDGSRIFVANSGTNDYVYQYDIKTAKARVAFGGSTA